MQSSPPGVSLKEIVNLKEISEALDLLSTVGKIPLVIYDDAGELIAAFSGEKGICPTAQNLRKNEKEACCCPCENQQHRHKDTLLVQKIRFHDFYMGEIRSCQDSQPDTELAHYGIQLAARWICEKIRSEFDTNSLSMEIINRYEDLNLLYELSAEMVSSSDPRKICEIVLKKVLNVIGAEKASILLFGPDLKRLHLMASLGFPQEAAENLSVDVNSGICGYVLKSGQPLLVEDIKNLPDEIKHRGAGYRTTSFLSVPLLLSHLREENKVVGVINLADKPSGQMYDSGDLKLLSAISSEVALSIYNSTLIRDLKENELMQKEMEIAEEVQKNLLPRKAPEIPGIELIGQCISAKKVGGDYFDFFPDSEGKVGIVLADVSGHSISSGIMMAITRGFLQGETVHSKGPHQLLQEVNRALHDDLIAAELFITMAYFNYDSERRWLSFANGGHNPSILIRADGGEPELLDAEGMAIGLLPEVMFEEKGWALSSGDLLVIYTDGLVEAEDRDKNRFGVEGLLSHLQKVRHRSAQEILTSLFVVVREHIGRQDPHNVQQDDITLVVLKVK